MTESLEEPLISEPMDTEETGILLKNWYEINGMLPTPMHDIEACIICGAPNGTCTDLYT